MSNLYGNYIDEANKKNEGNIEAVNEIALFSNRNAGPKELKYSLRVEPDYNRLTAFLKDPYIKLVNSINWDSATKTKRFSMITGKPIPKHEDGKGDITINKDVLKFMNDSMSKRSSYKGLDVYSAFYQFLYDAFKTEKEYKQISPNGNMIIYPLPIFTI